MQLTILTNVLTKSKDIDQTINIFSTSTTGLGSWFYDHVSSIFAAKSWLPDLMWEERLDIQL
jgi:hypothetical protein